MKDIKRVIVHILAVVMVLSGIGTFGAIEANARTPYETLIPDETKDLSTLVVTFNGYKWYIIEDNSQSDGTLTLLAADTSFGVAEGKYEDGNRYADDVLSGLTAPGGSFAGVADAVKEIRFLSREEAEKLPAKVRKMDFSADGEGDAGWWLKNTNGTDRDIIKSDGEWSYQSKDKKYGVRPILVLDRSKVSDPGWREFIYDYKLWVGTSKVTSQEGKSSGKGWSYDANNNTLTLNNYTATTSEDYHEETVIRTYGVYYIGDKDLTVKIDGESTIGSSERKPLIGIISEKTDVTITGSGTLDLTAKKSAIEAGDSVEIAGGTITAVSTENAAINAANDVKINGGDVTASAQSNMAITSGKDVIISDGTVTATSEDYVAIASGSEGNINISGGEVTASSRGSDAVSSGKDVIISGGTVNATAEDGEAIASAKDVVISGGTVNAYSKSYDAISSSNDVTISGGTVTATADENTAISSGAKGKIVISGGTVTTTAKSDAICSSKDVEISGGTVKADSSDDSGISAVNVIIGKDAKLTASGAACAVYGIVKNSIAGTGWTKVDGTGDGTRIYKNTDGQDLDDLEYKKVEFPRLQYDVIIDKTGEGKVMADPTEGDEGDEVTLTAKPDEGYWLKSLKATSVPKDGEPTTGLSLDDIYDLLAEQPLYLNGDKNNTYLKASDGDFCVSYNAMAKSRAIFKETGNGKYVISAAYNPFTLTFTVQGGELRKADVTTSSSASSDQRRAGTYTPVYPEIELTPGDDNTYTFKLPAADVCVDVVFAVGDEDNVRTVTFVLNGGTMTDPVVRVQKGDTVERPASDPSKAGKYFDDWYVDDSLTEVFDFDGTTIEDDTNIYAGWANGIVAVAWDQEKNEPDRDGKYGAVRIGDEGSYRFSSSTLVVDGHDFTLYAKASSGYRFAGWMTSSDETDPDKGGDTLISKDNPYKGKNDGSYTIYYAMFEEATPYDLSVTPYDKTSGSENAGGKIRVGTDGDYSDKRIEETVYEKETVTLFAEPDDGYEFLGWAASKDSDEYVNTDAEYSFEVTGNTSYYAIFKAHEHGLTHVEAKDPTCAAEGNTEYWVCDQGDHACGKFFSDAGASTETTKEDVTIAIEPDAHDWNTDNVNVTWTKTTATASVICRNDGSHELSETVDLSSAETKAPTCEGIGETTYTANFTNEILKAAVGDNNTRTEDITPLGHEWSEWEAVSDTSGDTPTREQRTCSRCGNTETRVIPAGHNCSEFLGEEVPEKTGSCTEQGMKAHYVCSECGAWYEDADAKKMTSEGECRIPATGHKEGEKQKGDYTKETCSSVGIIHYDIYCDNCGTRLRGEQEIIPFDSDAHDWAEPTYEWSDDYSTCTAKRVCNNNKDEHIEEETVDSTSVTKEATEEKAGSITYTAEFTNDAFKTQTAEEEIPKLPKTIKSVDVDLTAPLCGTEITWSKPDGGLPSAVPEVTITTDTGYSPSSMPVWMKDGVKFSGTIKGGETYSAFLTIMIPYKDQASYQFAKDVKVTVNGKEVKPSISTDLAMIATADITAEHDWGDWKVTREATNAAEGEKTRVCKGCGEKQTQAIPKLDTSKPVLAAKGIAKGKKAGKISWNKVKGADRYVVYLAKCNYGTKKYSFKKVKTLSGKKLKYTAKKLKKKTCYKFYVVAQKKVNGKYKNIATSYEGHFCTGNVRGSLTNPKSMKLNKTKVTLSKGGTVKLTAKVTKVKKSKKLATTHAKLLRYKSNNPTVAAVNASGKVTAKSPGTATIYVQTINGMWKTCKVTVK